MNILFTGPAGLISEWLEVCSDHECVVYARGVKKKLGEDVQLVHALDEAPRVDLVIDLHVRNSKNRRIILSDIIADVSQDAPILCNTVSTTATELASRVGAMDRIVGLAALPGLIASDVVEVCFPYGAKHGHQEILTDFIAGLGKRMEVVRDEVGLVTPRMLAVTINEAVLICQQDLTGQEAIDALMNVAMRDRGPLSWGHRIGWRHLYTILSAMHEELGGERYRPAPLLKKMAMIE
jgi:3-hydroxybutyryl-CoA dehydrogenase